MVLSKGAITRAEAEKMTYGEASAWGIALGEANGGKWNWGLMQFDKPETGS